jgi:hypothetical protein
MKRFEGVMSRNPYHAPDGIPVLRPSVVAVIDILGYMDMITTSEKEGTQKELLQRLHRALSTNRTWLEENHEMRLELDRDLYALKAFTDNIVLAWPVLDDAESELGGIFSRLADFQFTMSLEGFFIRGGIALGMAYVDDLVVFGDGLTQAYLAESKLARDPRIVLSESAVNAVRRHLGYYHDFEYAPQARELLCDSDGQWFLNYLDCVLYAEYESGPFYEQLLGHKAAVEAKLVQYKSNPLIFSKYAWVANYHNFFCNLNSKYFNRHHQIETYKYNAMPRRIVQASEHLFDLQLRSGGSSPGNRG